MSVFCFVFFLLNDFLYVGEGLHVYLKCLLEYRVTRIFMHNIWFACVDDNKILTLFLIKCMSSDTPWPSQTSSQSSSRSHPALETLRKDDVTWRTSSKFVFGSWRPRGSRRHSCYLRKQDRARRTKTWFGGKLWKYFSQKLFRRSPNIIRKCQTYEA